MFVAVLALCTVLSITVPLSTLLEMKQQRTHMRELNAHKQGGFYAVPYNTVDSSGTEIEQYKYIAAVHFPGLDLLISTFLMIATIGGFINWIM